MKTAPNIVVGTENEVVQRLNEYLSMAKKFISKNRDYQPLYKIICLSDNSFYLVFKLVKKNRHTIKEQSKFYNDYNHWNDCINNLVQS